MFSENFIETLRRTPFVRLTVPFILGIYVEEIFIRSRFNIAYFLIFVLIVFCILFFIKKSKTYNLRWIWGITIFTVLFFLGATIMQNQQQTSRLPLNENQIFQLKIISEPQPNERYTKVTAQVQAYSNGTNNISTCNEKTIVYFGNADSLQIPQLGDIVLIGGSINEIKPPQNPDEFNYKQYLARRKIFSSAFVKSNNYKIIGNNISVFDKVIHSLQTAMFKHFEDVGIAGNELAVLRALTFGDKQLLDENLRNSYASAGAMHVLAVSGLHVGLVYVVLNFLLAFMNRKRLTRIAKTLIIICVLWLYAALASFSPSVCRACVMFSFLLIGQLFGRNINVYNSLAASALFLCALNPSNIFEVGFQLSYSALLAIVYFQPKIYKLLFVQNKILDKIWALVCVAIAAQIGTAAISIFYFHQFPNYFIITNIIIIPLVTIAMYLIAGALLFAWFPPIYAGVGKLLEYCLWLTNKSIEHIEKLPFSLTENIYINSTQTLIIIGIFVCIALFIELRNRRFLIVILALIVVFAGINSWQKVNIKNQIKMIVYNVRGASFINFVEGKKSVCLRDTTSINKNFDFNVKNNLTKLGISKTEIFSDVDELPFSYKNFIYFDGKTMKIYDKNERYKALRPMPIKYLIVNRNSGWKAQLAFENYAPQKLIIDSSVFPRMAQTWIAEAEAHGVKYHYVAENGAFISE